MGISERREREKNERRQTILNCAKELILSQGVERVSMEDIAQKAELSKATVYLYFSGKEVLFNEICEEAARKFLGHFTPILESGLTGMDAMKLFWRGYLEIFGSFDDMVIILKVRSFLTPGLPIVMLETEKKSPYVNAIIEAVKTLIEQCKTEGVFDPDLDSTMATRLLLSMFSSFVENAARIPAEGRKSQAVINEMTNAFQIVIRGFAREGIDRACLNIG